MRTRPVPPACRNCCAMLVKSLTRIGPIRSGIEALRAAVVTRYGEETAEDRTRVHIVLSSFEATARIKPILRI